MNSFERYFLIAGWGGREGIKNGLVEMLPKKHHDEKKELARGEKNNGIKKLVCVFERAS